MNKLIDLRFVIGLFFLVVGILLFIYHFFITGETEGVNLWCGILFIVFAIIMLLLSREGAGQKKDEK